MKKFQCAFYSLLLFSFDLHAQDSVKVTPPTFRLGIGYEVSNPVWGPHAFIYYKGMSVNATYGLSTESNRSSSIIKELNKSYYLGFAMSWGAIYGKGRNTYWPLIVGFGWTYADEKSQVEGYTGEGVIRGRQIYVGVQQLWTEVYNHKIGTHIYLGKNSWDYSKSLLKKNNSDQKYNYMEFYASLGVYFFLF